MPGVPGGRRNAAPTNVVICIVMLSFTAPIGRKMNQKPPSRSNVISLSEIERPIGPSGHFPTAVGKHQAAMRQPLAPCRSGELSAKLTEGQPLIPFSLLMLMTSSYPWVGNSMMMDSKGRRV